VIYNHTDDVYMVVWMYDVSGNNTRYEIWGSIIPWNATSFGTVFQIGNWSDPYNMWYPTVAWNHVQNEYLVIWDTYMAGNPQHTPLNIGYRVVSSDGTPGAGGTITTDNSPIESDMVYNPSVDQYFIVWQALQSGETDKYYIYGHILNADLSTARSDYRIYLDLDEWYDDYRNPAIATDEQAWYTVALQAWSPTYDSWKVVTETLDVNGDSAGGYRQIGGTVQYNPDIVARGGNLEWLLTWESTEVAGTAINGMRYIFPYEPDEIIVPDNLPQLYFAFWHNRVPAVVGGVHGYLITYTGRSNDPNDWQHIYATKVWQAGIFIPLIIR
jgi:hypothetical protein